jgi:regulator of RNase E activity RraA
MPNACYGGLMTARAKYQGAVGSVIDGRFRDLQEQREQKFPVSLVIHIPQATNPSDKPHQVFARDIGTAPPGQVAKVTGTNVPVKLNSEEQDVTINPGDYIIADMNGVVVLPKELAEEALPYMKKQVDADTQVAKAIGEGMSVQEAMKASMLCFVAYFETKVFMPWMSLW